MILGFVGIAVVLLSWVVAHYISWFFPRGLQHAQKAVTHPVMLLTLDRLIPREHYTAKDISPHFWPNGKMPVREDWKQLVAGELQELQAQDHWPGRESGGAVVGRSPHARERREHHHASLHPGLVRHRAMGRSLHAQAHRACQTASFRQGGRVLLFRRLTLWGSLLRHADHR